MSTDFGAVCILECGQTDRCNWTPYPTPATIQPVWVKTSTV